MRFIPIFAASPMRRSTYDTGRTSPPSPTSPTKTASGGSAGSYTLDASAAATDRLPAGVWTRTPPDTMITHSQHAVIERVLALEVEHRANDVLERLGAGDAAALGHMPDHEHGGRRLFGVAHEARGTFAHLADVPGRALQVRREDGLN